MKKLILSAFAVTGLLTIMAFQYGLDKKGELLPEAYKLVPAGFVEINGEKVEVPEFYMFHSEITNQDYRNIMTYCKQWDPDKFVPMLPDTLVWNQWAEGGKMHPYSGKYFMTADYALYPVVGIDPKGAQLYCQVIQAIFTERLAQVGKKVKVHLPTEAQYLRAAEGSNPEWNYSNGNKVKDSKGKKLYQYKELPEEWLGFGNDSGKEGMKVHAKEEWFTKHQEPMECKSYEPNEFGIYDLNGNVMELLYNGAEAVGGHFDNAAYDIRNRSKVPVQMVSPTLGFRVVIEIIE